MGAHKTELKKSHRGGGVGSEYRSKRAKNNEAVRRSREKARHKAKETHERVTQLKRENEMLEERIKLLSKELEFLKDIFLAHAGNSVIFQATRLYVFYCFAFFSPPISPYSASSHGLCLDDLEIKALMEKEEHGSNTSADTLSFPKGKE